MRLLPFLLLLATPTLSDDDIPEFDDVAFAARCTKYKADRIKDLKLKSSKTTNENLRAVMQAEIKGLSNGKIAPFPTLRATVQADDVVALPLSNAAKGDDPPKLQRTFQIKRIVNDHEALIAISVYDDEPGRCRSCSRQTALIAISVYDDEPGENHFLCYVKGLNTADWIQKKPGLATQAKLVAPILPDTLFRVVGLNEEPLPAPLSNFKAGEVIVLEVLER